VRATAQNQSRSGHVLSVLFCLSLLANLLLIGHLIRSRSRTPLAATATVPTANQTQKAAELKDGVGSPPSPAAEMPAAGGSPPFLWAEVESADYRQYIANLRAVGCPEGTLRDIIAADLNQLFAAKAAQIWKPAEPAPYWRKAANDRPAPDQSKELNALAKEQSAILQDLLGTRINQQELVDRVYLQFHCTEKELAFLPAQKREAALQATAVLDQEMQEDPEGYWENRSRLFTRKMEVLANVLSPAELTEFRLRNSPAAENLRMETQYFDCTPDDFQKLVDARKLGKNGETPGPDLLNRAAATEQVRRIFGDERAKEFERVSELFYINSRRAATDQGLGVDTGEAAWKVTRDIRDAASRIGTGPIASEEGKAQVEALLGQARTQLDSLLGSAAARSMVRDLRNVILAPPLPSQP
jgi:hypothetical protein